MRLMIVVFVLATLIIVDQFRFRGYYGAQVSHFFSRMVSSVI